MKEMSKDNFGMSRRLRIAWPLQCGANNEVQLEFNFSSYDDLHPPCLSFTMSARKPSKVNGGQSKDAKDAVALQQYNDTEGHFSLVRCVIP